MATKFGNRITKDLRVGSHALGVRGQSPERNKAEKEMMEDEGVGVTLFDAQAMLSKFP